MFELCDLKDCRLAVNSMLIMSEALPSDYDREKSQELLLTSKIVRFIYRGRTEKEGTLSLLRMPLRIQGIQNMHLWTLKLTKMKDG
jgi:hypothetical protein